MNSQDFRSLQEAYIQVYELDESFADRIDKQVKKNKEYAKKRKPVNASSFADRIDKQVEQRKKEKDRLKEQVDLYDIILSHLLDEGYAETQEQAEVIMVNMSEDWRESICEGYIPLPVEKMDAKAKELKSKFRKSKVGTPEAKKLLSRLGHILATRDSNVV